MLTSAEYLLKDPSFIAKQYGERNSNISEIIFREKYLRM